MQVTITIDGFEAIQFLKSVPEITKILEAKQTVYMKPLMAINKMERLMKHELLKNLTVESLADSKTQIIKDYLTLNI